MDHLFSTKRQKWVDHNFTFAAEVGRGRNILTRISDIGFRCQYHCAEFSNELLSTRINKKWSIKEHLGHLIDLEELHIIRINQFKDLKKDLKAADMSNQKTEISKHNYNSFEYLINNLITKREKLVLNFQSLNEESINHYSFHPRLEVQMRPVDLMFFIGEHDDHHLTSFVVIKK